MPGRPSRCGRARRPREGRCPRSGPPSSIRTSCACPTARSTGPTVSTRNPSRSNEARTASGTAPSASIQGSPRSGDIPRPATEVRRRLRRGRGRGRTIGPRSSDRSAAGRGRRGVPVSATRSPSRWTATGISVCAGRLPGRERVGMAGLEREASTAVVRNDPSGRLEHAGAEAAEEALDQGHAPAVGIGGDERDRVAGNVGPCRVRSRATRRGSRDSPRTRSEIAAMCPSSSSAETWIVISSGSARWRSRSDEAAVRIRASVAASVPIGSGSIPSRSTAASDLEQHEPLRAGWRHRDVEASVATAERREEVGRVRRRGPRWTIAAPRARSPATSRSADVSRVERVGAALGEAAQRARQSAAARGARLPTGSRPRRRRPRSRGPSGAPRRAARCSTRGRGRRGSPRAASIAARNASLQGRTAPWRWRRPIRGRRPAP